ncbi:MAG: DUF5711 family protein [Lachnospiraceae bacterium]|nr:DUF5711 family protein [Lachnospiraceae bacterium]
MPNLKVVDNTEKQENFDAKVTKHKLFRTIRIVIIVAVIIAGYLFVTNYLDRKVYTDYTVTARSVRSDSDTAKYMAYNGHVLKYSQDGVEAFDGLNKTIWNITYEMQTPHIATCENYVAMGDEGATSILVVDGSGNQTTIDTRLPIKDFCVASQGVVAAVLEDGNATRINVYDKDGNQLAGLKCTMTQSGYPVAIALSPSGLILGVSYIRMDQGELTSSIAFYNFGDVGQNETDNYVSGYDYGGSIYPELKFLNDEAIVAIGDDSLVTFRGSQKPEMVSNNSIDSEIQSVFYGDDEIALVFRDDKSNDSYKLNLYDSRGKLKLEKEFELAYTDIQISSRQIIIYNESECLIFNKRGLQKYKGDFDDTVLLMTPTSTPARYYLINREITQMIRLN